MKYNCEWCHKKVKEGDMRYSKRKKLWHINCLQPYLDNCKKFEVKG